MRCNSSSTKARSLTLCSICPQITNEMDAVLPLVLRTSKAANAQQARCHLLFSLYGALGQRLHRVPEAHELLTMAVQARLVCSATVVCLLLLSMGRITIARPRLLLAMLWSSVCTLMAAGGLFPAACDTGLHG